MKPGERVFTPANVVRVAPAASAAAATALQLRMDPVAVAAKEASHFGAVQPPPSSFLSLGGAASAAAGAGAAAGTAPALSPPPPPRPRQTCRCAGGLLRSGGLMATVGEVTSTAAEVTAAVDRSIFRAQFY